MSTELARRETAGWPLTLLNTCASHCWVPESHPKALLIFAGGASQITFSQVGISCWLQLHPNFLQVPVVNCLYVCHDGRKASAQGQGLN